MSYLKYDGTTAAESATPVANFYGTSGADTLNGTAAAEAFTGNAADLMSGGAGDDTYYLQSAAAKIVEQAGGGTDTLVAWKNTGLDAYAYIENLKVDGDGLYGAGNAKDNIIYAGSGAEQLYGGLGQDVLVAGSGKDTFIVEKGQGNDAIYGFKTASDILRLSAGYTSFAQVQGHMTQVGADTRIDLGGSDGVVLRGVQASTLSAANFQLGLDTSKLGAMTFHDEFSSNVSIWNATYNPTGMWRPDYGYQGANGVGSYTLTGNGEKQIYTSPYFRNHNGDFSESPFVNNGDGTLSIVAKPSTNPELFGYGYTSGMLSTKESFAQTYGYFEMRAELPQSAGGWPAFWLVPADGSWPPELDVMETLTSDPHADWTTAHSQASGTHTSNGISSYISDTSDGFHTYGVLWTASNLTWYVDGTAVFQQATPADMNKPMYMIANLALGGWGGAIDNSTMPEQMKIDYVRSYALADGSTKTQGFDAITGGGSSYVSPPANIMTDGASASPPPVSPPPVSPPPVSPPVSPPPVSAPPVSPPPVSPPATGAGLTLTSHGYGDTLIGTAGADTLVASQGGETMTGGAGADSFVFRTTPWTPTHISDFQPGVDRIDLSGLYLGGYNGTDPVADGYVKLTSDGAGGTAVIVDPDGRASGHPWGDYVVDLEHVAPAGLTSAQLFGGSGPAASPPPVSPPPASPPPVASGQVLSAAKPGDILIGGAGADTLNASQGADTLTGGAGADRFVFGKAPWAPAHITDFTHAQDVIDLRGLFAGTGYAGTDPVADRYLSLISDGKGGTAILFDRDGAGTGQQWGSYVIDLEHVSPSTLSNSDWVIR